MASVFDSVSIKGLRTSHFVQLLSYLKDRDISGWYYGNKEQFEKRHNDLETWLEGIISHAKSEGIVIPKK